MSKLLNKNEYFTVSFEQLKDIFKKYKGKISHVYIHWTAGTYSQVYNDYHISVDDKGNIFMPSAKLDIHRPHTAMRNTGAIGITANACYGAHSGSHGLAEGGEYLPTQEQIETISKILAIANKYMGIPLSIKNMMTHTEAAINADGRNVTKNYGPVALGGNGSRWDFWKIRDWDYAIKNGGDVFRGKAVWYLQEGEV